MVQFSVLADGLSGRDTKLGGFDSAPKDSLKWEARRERLLEEIFRHGPEPDVIALEEVDHFDDWFMPQLQKRGYRGFFLKKPKSPCLKTAPGSGLEGRLRPVLPRGDRVRGLCGDDELQRVEPGRAPRDGASCSLPLSSWRARTSSRARPRRARRRASGQVCKLMERLDTMGLPCVICLDMNAAPIDDAAAYACGSYAARAYPATTSALGPPTRRRAPSRRGRRGSAAARRARHCIDYVLCSPEVGVSQVLLPPDDDAVVEERLRAGTTRPTTSL